VACRSYTATKSEGKPELILRLTYSFSLMAGTAKHNSKASKPERRERSDRSDGVHQYHTEHHIEYHIEY